MERLTERNKYKAAYYPYCFKENTCDGKGTSKKCDYCEFSTMVCERLAEYEDTGLTPEQILAMDEEYAKMAKELGEYKRLEKQGRLIKLLCEVGDRFWELNAGNGFARIYPRMAYSLQHCVYVMERLGKTVFLTKEEAEKALEEMEK